MKQEEVKEGFDFKVTHRDPKTGLVVAKNPYVCRVIGAQDGSKRKVYERPVGSGNMWDAKNNPAGRWVDGKLDEAAAHVAFKTPETKDQVLAKSLLSKESKIAELEKELASIKAEAKKK